MRRLLTKRAEILECRRITGEDCYMLKVSAENTAHLQDLVDELSEFGHATTSVVYSETLPYRGPWTTRTLPADPHSL
jgi:Lrp/AsnC family leucine-responsive transcriptional regulator